MQKDQAISYFRKLAKLLHPDKNQHPLAKEAFQKLSEAF
jgi:curved DNA-binding protein CbpA